MVITSKNKRSRIRPYSSAQLRFAVTSAIITGLVLLFLNVYCSQFSQELFYQSKQSTMVAKATLTASELGNADVLTESSVAATISRLGGNESTRLIVTDAAGRVLYDTLGSGENTYALFPQIIGALQGKDLFYCHFADGVLCSQTAIPIISYNSISGCVYMMDMDPQQGHLLASLQNAILTISILLEIFLLVFAVFYAHRFSRRMRKIMTSMRIIQDGDYTHKVSLAGNDELATLGREFDYLTERLQTSENKRRQFVSDASHELKTPLASIKLLSDSILQYDMDPETTKEFVQDIGNEAERLNRMTLKLLALTKGEQSMEETDAEIIYMAPTINRVVKMLSAIAQENKITLRVDLRQDSPVLIQEDDLYQIAFNLAENAIKYNVPGGTLTVSLHRQDDMAILRVSDTGMGIPPEAISHVFERFYRVDKARARQSGGSGLGLAIVRSMVERNGGEISLQSTVGKGTTFTVSFPCFDIDEEVEA